MSSTPPRVYLDSNVFMAAFETAGAHSDHAWWILQAVQDGEILAATSEITLAEILVKPFEKDQTQLVTGYESMMISTGGFEVRIISRDVLVVAAQLRATRNATKLPDAIHIATAQSAACSFFVSDDRRINVPNGMTRLPVNPFTLDDIFKVSE